MQVAILMTYGVGDLVIGEHLEEDNTSIRLGYASTLVAGSNDTYHLVPLPLPGTLIGPGFGRDSVTTLSKDKLFLWSVLEVSMDREEKSEHPVIEIFKKFWDI